MIKRGRAQGEGGCADAERIGDEGELCAGRGSGAAGDGSDKDGAARGAVDQGGAREDHHRRRWR